MKSGLLLFSLMPLLCMDHKDDQKPSHDKLSWVAWFCSWSLIQDLRKAKYLLELSWEEERQVKRANISSIEKYKIDKEKK